MCESATVTDSKSTSNTPISFNGSVLRNTDDTGYFLIIGTVIDASNQRTTVWLVRIFSTTPYVVKVAESGTSGVSLSLFFSATGNLCMRAASENAYHYSVIAV